MIHSLEISKNLTFTLRINFNKSSLHTFKEKMNSLISNISEHLDRISLDLAIVDVPVSSNEYISVSDRFKIYDSFYKYLLDKHIQLPTRFINGGDCMARNEHVILLDSDGSRYPCFSFVGNHKFKIGKEDNSYFDHLEKCTKECDLHEICIGGCIYENYCKNETIEAQCNYNSLLQLNRKLFLYKLKELGYITDNELEDSEHVQTFSINI